MNADITTRKRFLYPTTTASPYHGSLYISQSFAIASPLTNYRVFTYDVNGNISLIVEVTLISLVKENPQKGDIDLMGVKIPQLAFDHVGIIVEDMDKAIEYFQSLGIGPFEPLNITATDRVVYGKPAPDVHNMTRVANIGSIQFELLQPVSGESVQKEFLEKNAS